MVEAGVRSDGEFKLERVKSSPATRALVKYEQDPHFTSHGLTKQAPSAVRAKGAK